jgi:hypothetical protein
VGLGLRTIFDAMRLNPGRLLTLMPELLEAYQSVDAEGRTVRRYAIIDSAAKLMIDASLPNPAPKRGTSGGAPLGGDAATTAASNGVHCQRAAGGDAACTRPPLPPPALEREMEAICKRYAVSVPANPTGAAVATPPIERLALAPTPTGAAAMGTAEQNGFEVEVQLQPTDPEWPSEVPLCLLCRVKQDYPAPGSFTVGVTSPKLPELHGQVLQRILAGEVEAAAGRPGALRSVLRFCENHGGSALQQAADLALEVARQRMQQGGSAAAAWSSAGDGSGVESGSDRQCIHGDEMAADALPSGDEDVEDDSCGDDSSDLQSGQTSGREDEEEAGVGREWEHGTTAQRALTWGGDGSAAASSHGGLLLLLDGLVLDGVDAIEPLQLNIQVGREGGFELLFVGLEMGYGSTPSRVCTPTLQVSHSLCCQHRRLAVTGALAAAISFFPQRLWHQAVVVLRRACRPHHNARDAIKHGRPPLPPASVMNAAMCWACCAVRGAPHTTSCPPWLRGNASSALHSQPTGASAWGLGTKSSAADATHAWLSRQALSVCVASEASAASDAVSPSVPCCVALDVILNALTRLLLATAENINF